MPRIWKEVLCSGVQRDARGAWFTIGPRNIREAHRNALRMLSRGLSVPCVWEHQNLEVGDRPRTPDEIADWKRRYAKFAFGHIVDARINDRGNLDLLHEVRDPADAAQLEKVRYCSPKIYPSYSDSRGGEYAGTTVAHVSATPTPVQHWQRPFSVPKSALARAGYDRPHELSQGSPLYLSYTPPEGPNVADAADDKGDEGGADGDLKSLVDALIAKGMTISPKVSSLRELIIAVESSGDASADVDTDLDDDDLDLDSTTAPAASAPTMMSTTDPAVRQRVTAWAKDERKDARSRIKALFQSGRIDRPTARQLDRQLGATEMSFNAEAVAVYPLANKLAELEKRPAGSVWKAGALDLSATRAVGTPVQLVGDQAKSGEDEAAKEMEEASKRYAGGVPAK